MKKLLVVLLLAVAVLVGCGGEGAETEVEFNPASYCSIHSYSDCSSVAMDFLMEEPDSPYFETPDFFGTQCVLDLERCSPAAPFSCTYAYYYDCDLP